MAINDTASGSQLDPTSAFDSVLDQIADALRPK